MTGVQRAARFLIRAQLAVALLAIVTIVAVLLVGLAGVGPFGHGSLPGR